MWNYDYPEEWREMIPVSTFNMLIAVDLILIIYSVIDLRNKMYANIIAAFLASILAGYLAVVMNAGIVQYSDATSVQDASISIIIGIFAVTMMVYTLLMVFEAREEKRMEAEEA
jgi:hypothetical protein